MRKPVQKAGVVAYRKNTLGEIEVILVSSRKLGDSWVFPAGGVDYGETPAEAAERECLEESGYKVEMEKPLEIMVIEGEKRNILYTFFQAKAIEDTGDYERDRKRKWCGIDNLPDTVAYLFREVAESFQKSIVTSQSQG
ncbi:MAG: NUDIX domain-containing protein [Candidatus Dadabacteria bacterium]|nr:NUDIX domain-containing protein [Candidatus Dadabacteria bacterium]MCY4261788.1 NUDIX domain-containing protein [Candidatus Dadabacteria bacterium]